MSTKTDAPATLRLRGPGLAAAVLAALAVIGCTGSDGPPPIRLGTACALCGMEVQDRRFACEREADQAWRVYDSIECLVADRDAAGLAYLADYDQETLHAADSVWIVQGDFPSPMGGGLAAFIDRQAAEAVAVETAGRVVPLATLLEERAGDRR